MEDPCLCVVCKCNQVIYAYPLGLNKSIPCEVVHEFIDYSKLNYTIEVLNPTSFVIDKCICHRPITAEQIQLEVCKEFKVNPEVMRLHKGPHELLRPRQVAIFFCYKILTYDYMAERTRNTKIGEIFHKDHGTVGHIVKAIERLYCQDRNLMLHIRKLNRLFAYQTNNKITLKEKL